MFLDGCILAVGSFVFGCATAAGVIGLVTTLGVVPRMIGRFHVAQGVLLCECAITLGGIIGCIYSIQAKKVPSLTGTGPLVWQGGGMFLIALAIGIYVGCQAMALAEILNTFPILFRRMKLQMGLRWITLSIAVGKLVGSLWYFAFGYQNG